MSKKPDWAGSIYTKAIGDIRRPLHYLTSKEEVIEVKEEVIREAADTKEYSEKDPVLRAQMDRVLKADADNLAIEIRILQDMIERKKMQEKLVKEMLEAANKTRKKDNN